MTGIRHFTEERYENIANIFLLARYDKGKAMAMLNGMRTGAIQQHDFLAVRKIEKLMELI
jgi:hypothetical protein